MHAQFMGDGADLPMLGVKVAANLRADFGTDHGFGSPSSWNAWKRIHELPSAATRPGNTSKRPGASPASEGVNRRRIGLELRLGLLPPAHIRIMPGQRSKGNPDPSRALAPGADGTAAAGRDDRADLPDSVDVAGWRRVAAGAGLDRGTSGC